jgi:hypothetical protein
MLRIPSTHLTSALALAALLAFGAPLASAQEGGRLTHEIPSDHLGQPRSVTVVLPASYSGDSEFEYPVLYLLDGETNVDHASAVTAFLAETGVMPEAMVVAIHAGATRGQDYLPPASADGAPGGRANAFVDFMESELVPFIEAEYRAGPYRMISGHSLGGLLVTYAAFLRPGVFDVHLAQSPYLDEALGTPLVEEIEARAAPAGGDTGAYYFATLGDEPELEPNFHRLAGVLAEASHPVRGRTAREPGASHMGTRLVGLYDGLHAHFEPIWSFDGTSSGGGEGGFLAFLDSLESHLGFPVRYSQSGFQREAQSLLQAGKAAEAEAVARRYVQQYPETPVASFLLGNARAAAGDRDGAVAAIRRAIELYESDPDPALAPLYQAMQRLLGNLGGAPAAAGLES